MNDDIVQFDYLPEEKAIRINLPEEVLKSIDTIIITKRFKDEIIISRKESIKIDDYTKEDEKIAEYYNRLKKDIK